MQLGGRVIFAVLLSAQTLVPQFLAQGDLTANAKQPWYRLVDMGTFGGRSAWSSGEPATSTNSRRS